MTAASPTIVAAGESVEPMSDSHDDRARLRQVALDHFADVWRFLRRLGVPFDSLDDAAQDVFLVAARKLPHVTPGMEKSYLFGAALRVARERRKKYAREELAVDPDDETLEPASDATPETVFGRKEERTVLLDLLSGLPDELRTAFVLYEIEGLPSPEIAVRLDIPVGTVASRLRRAREKFEERLQKLQARRRGET